MIHCPKSMPGPECLEIEKSKPNAAGDHKCGDVVRRLIDDFHNKCYLCEHDATSFNVEHFKPHRNGKYPDRKFDWENLFWCCAHCNNTKNALEKYEDILNCTIATDNVDTDISYHMDWSSNVELAIFRSLKDDPRVNNTVDLLTKIFEGSTDIQQLGNTHNLRKHLFEEVRKFKRRTDKFLAHQHSPDQSNRFRRLIVNQLKLSSPFTAFKRWIIRDNPVLMAEFGQYLA